MTIKERLYWLLFWLQSKTRPAAQALGFDFLYYRNRAVRGEYPEANQAAEYDISVTPAVVEPGGKYYRLVLAHHLKPGENGFNHHLYADVVDTAGYRIQGARLIVWNNNLPPARMVIDKPGNEPGTNTPMWWGDTLSIAVDPEWSGVKSDKVNGFHTRWPDESDDVRRGHHSGYVVFQETTPEPEPEPEPEPSEPPVVDSYRLAVLGPEGRVVGYEQYLPGLPPKGRPCWVVLRNGQIVGWRGLES